MRNEIDLLQHQIEDLKADNLRLRQSENEAVYRSLFEDNHAVMLLIDPETAAIKDANPAACAYYGWSQEQLKALRIDEINTLTRDEIFAQMQLALAERRRNFFFKHRRADGSIRDVEIFSGPLTVKGQRLLYSIVHDITERKLAEDALRESKDRFRNLVESAPIGIFTTSSNGKVLSINLAMARILDFPSQEEAIKRYTDLSNQLYVQAERRDEFLRLMRNFGHVEDFEYQARTATGRIIWLSMSARISERREDGSFIIEGFAADITERKRTEEALRKSEEIFHAFMEHCPVYVFFKDESIRPIRLSRNYEQMLGRPVEDVLGKNMEELFPADLAKGMIADDLAVINAGKAIKVVEELNGRTFETTKFPIQQHGKPTMLAGFTIDITDRKLADQHREKLETQLRQAQKMEAIGTLAGGIAHDFNNILSIIIGNAEILGMSNISFSGNSELDQILSASKRAKQLVRQILAFSRQGEQQKLLMSLKPVVKETIEFLRSSIPSVIQIQHYIHHAVPAVMADPTQMQQVLMNLCTNAAHAMEKDGGVLKVELGPISVSEEDAQNDPEVDRGEYVRLTVSDTGHGIEPTLIPRIFDPYFTTKGPDKGTGLGLSVVHGIVKSHGGIIKVYSEVGKGTAFCVLIPKADGVEAQTEEKRFPTLPLGKEKILVVDDEKHVVEMYQRMLGLLGYQVEARTSPLEAIEAVRANPRKYDLVLTDMTMPHMTGYALAKHLMEMQPNLPIILCTGFGDQINENKAQSAGILALLLKPVLFNDLANTLREVLDRNREKAH